MVDFDIDLNRSLHENVQDSTSLTVGDVAGGVVASIVDAGASMWNSLPGTPEVETADLLRRVSTNALKVYEENPETIQTASFIGGMFVPMGIAAKGIGLLRAGTKGASWFNYASREADMAKAAKLFEEAGGASKEYRNLVRGIYTKSAVNQAIDAIAMEAALVGMYNSHPLMEDYMQEPGKNFALSAAFGGIIGGTVGHVADRFVLRGMTGEVLTKALDETVGQMRNIAPDMTNATALQSHWLNQNNLDNIMKQRAELGKNETNDIVYFLAKGLKEQTILKQNELFESMISKEIQDLPAPEKNKIMELVINKPEMFGVENISLLTEKEITAKGIIKAPKFGLKDEPSLVDTKGFKPKPKKALYFPELGLYGVESDAIHFAGASTLGKTKEQLEKTLASNYGKIPNMDSSLELISKSSASVEAEYIAAMVRVEKMSVKDLEKLHISETDGPLLSAVIVRMLKDPEAAKVLIQTSDRSPVYKQILQKKTEELISEGKIAATGPDASYQAAVKKINDDIDNYRPGTNYSGPSTVRDAISDWIGGDKMTLNKASIDFLAREVGGYARTGVSKKSADLFDSIYNSPESKALRAEFSKIADADGMVYLYRGWKTKNIKGKQPLDSYTTAPSKAAQFTGDGSGPIRLYRVPVDDIVAGFSDVGGGPVTTEIIVRASARLPEAELDAAGKAAFKASQAKEGQVVKTTVETTTSEVVMEGGKRVSFKELQNMLIAQKEEAIDSLLAQGIPFQSIAKKTNTSLRNVEYFAINKAGGGSLADLLTIDPDAFPTVAALSKIKSLEDADEILKPTNQPMVLAGNMRKNQYVQNHIGLNNKTISDMNKEATALIMLGSKSSAAQDMGKFFYSEEYSRALDMLKAQLGAVNNELAGSGFWNSADFFTRKMKDAGPIISLIGKQVQEISNAFSNKIVQPIERLMATSINDAAAVLEFNMVADLNASLKGWRMWSEDGKLMQKVTKTMEDGKKVEVLEPVEYQGKVFQIKTPSVLNLVKEIQSKSPELLALANTIKKIQGAPDVNDIGFWMPSFNPVNKFIAYVHNKATDETKLLWGRTQAEFDEAVNSYKRHLDSIGDTETLIVKKGQEQELWSLLNGRLDPIHMERADPGMQKKGSTGAAIVKSDNTIFSEVAGGYQHYISAQMRTLADLNLSEITDSLRRMSTLNKAATAGQPLDKIKKIISAPKDAAAIAHNILLGNHNLGEYAGWATTNKNFETYLTFGANAVRDVWHTFTDPLTKTFLGGRKQLSAESMKKVDYEAFAKELEARGIHNPYQVFDDEAAKMFGLSKLEDNKDTSKRIIYASNALAATAALRFGELAQPLVNALSLPILTSLAIAERMPSSFMGVQRATAKVTPVSVMYDGARAMNSPLFESLNKKWEEMGFFKALVSEVNDVQRAARRFEKGAVAKIENALDSKLVDVMSKTADYSEALTRKLAMNTGAVLAKRLYPELDDAGVTIFARDFMDKAVGNFHASQRPVFFQGTLGVALGLFQTYSLTLAQSVYRGLELKNYKALGKAALLQSTIFGTRSMPGFDKISTAIGDHFSDENVDLTTGTYRATGDTAADFILYGLPSNLGPSITGRGDVNPRMPGINGLVAYNFLNQTGQMLGEIKRGLDADAPEMARSLAQALSLQSMSRPLARTAELATGYSITRAGNTVQIPEEVWTTTGVFARILGTRPLEEQKLRDADHLNRFYGALDRDNRQEVMMKLKTAIRNGTLTDEQVSEAALEYFRKGGTPRGWKSAINTAIAKTDSSGKEIFLEKLRDDNPLMFMIDELD